LKGGARMAEINSIGDLSHELETLFERIVDNQYAPSAEMVSLCLACHDALANMVDAVSAGRAAKPAEELLEQIKEVVRTGQAGSATEAAPELEQAIEEDLETDSQPAFEPESLEGDLLPLFQEESKDILTAAAEYLEHWRDDPEGLDGIVELEREMHTLKGGARLADVDPIADLAEAVENRLEQLVEGQIGDHKALQSAVIKAYQAMARMLENLVNGEAVIPEPDLVKEVMQAGDLETTTPQDTGHTGETELSSWLSEMGEVDEEVLEMFIEEAAELTEALEEQISAWGNDPESDAPNREIQRILHTLKGGARLSNLSKLADEAHDLETKLISAQESKQAFGGDFKQLVLDKQDILLKLVDEVKSLAGGGAKETPAAEEKTKAPEPKTAPQAATLPEKVKAPEIQKPVVEAPKVTTKAAPQETIRVSAGLLEELVNLAGETSISRGRLEQQISDFGFTLEEMSATIERLREQLRRLEMETEAQVLYTVEKEGLASEYEDFDPLEMDRYSTLQQLSRALTESTTDLLELRETLADRSRDAETLLLQQSRINSELQEGLMKTRMIPFSSMVPRLRRIVRQISGELNKKIEFDVANAAISQYCGSRYAVHTAELRPKTFYDNLPTAHQTVHLQCHWMLGTTYKNNRQR
jgi:chemosensory pili system protein ChpA (sensor histidine kinase/response regulator)